MILAILACGIGFILAICLIVICLVMADEKEDRKNV